MNDTHLHTHITALINSAECGHTHCYHMYTGAIWMVVPDGHVVQKCCKCTSTRTVHIDHTRPIGWNFGGRKREPFV